jgi:predicted  nucleic acid-binding Zn-ribbon protein
LGETLKDKISQLIELQALDDKIEQINNKKAKGPLRIRELKDTLDAAEADFQKDFDQLELFKKERRRIEQEIQDLENKIEKSTTKLYSIKSNKEYTAALKEIDDLKKIKFVTEDKVIQAMEQIEEIEKKSLEHKKRQPEMRAQFEKAKTEIEKELAALDRDLGDLNGRREILIQSVDQDLLKRYEVLKDRRGGRAISQVIAGVCQACHINIPPQKFNDLIRGESLLTCPHCHRIIYWGEDEDFQKRESVVG